MTRLPQEVLNAAGDARHTRVACNVIQLPRANDAGIGVAKRKVL